MRKQDSELSARSRDRLLAWFVLGVLAFNYPLLALFDRIVLLFGIPLLVLYLYGFWLLSIVILAVWLHTAARSSPHDD